MRQAVVIADFIERLMTAKDGNNFRLIPFWYQRVRSQMIVIPKSKANSDNDHLLNADVRFATMAFKEAALREIEWETRGWSRLTAACIPGFRCIQWRLNLASFLDHKFNFATKAAVGWIRVRRFSSATHRARYRRRSEGARRHSCSTLKKRSAAALIERTLSGMAGALGGFATCPVAPHAQLSGNRGATCAVSTLRQTGTRAARFHGG